jgi:hypothetical protein
MADFQTSEVDTKFALVRFGLSRARSSNHANQSILVRQLMSYLCDSMSHSLTDCLTTVIMLGDVTMETKIVYCS